MGCSPSKGQFFSGVSGQPTALPSTSGENCLSQKPGEGETPCLETDVTAEECLSPGTEEPPMRAKTDEVAESPDVVSNPENITTIEVNTMSKGRDTQSEMLPLERKMKKIEKRRKLKGSKQGRQRETERNSSLIHTKVDLPMNMVKAHQAAYAYLNPNISKYETLLGLLDQATQTQLSLQPMMTAIVLRFDDINQALEEMAEEGEQMLKEHGDHMAWPSGMRALPPVITKPNINSSDPPPDLLQQMLQHSIEKMKLVGSSVHSLGDTTLEEAVEFFASLSNLLGERLQAKRTAEVRLTQVLARVEAAAMRKSSPEDSALHSEDSGIGGENESLPGSDRQRRHRGSSGSDGNARAIPQCPPNQVFHNEDEEGEEEEEDDDDYEDEEEESERSGRKRSNSSPPDPSQPVLPVPTHHRHNHLPRRPLTAAPSSWSRRPLRSQSTECMNALLELQKNQRDLDQRMKKMADRAEGGANYALYRVGLRRHSSGSGVARHALKGPQWGNQAPSALPALVPHPPGRHSVRKLINTFSNGVDGRPGQSLANIPSHIRGARKSGTPCLPIIGNGEQSPLSNGNNNNNSWPGEGREDVDVDSLPPPPPEVLMDNSFQSTEETTEDEGGLEEEEGRSRSTARQRSGVSQRLRASMQNATVLPNRGTVRHSSLSMSPAPPVRQNAVVAVQGLEQLPDQEPDPEKEQAANLYRQARKIIHLRNAAASPVKIGAADKGVKGPSPLQTGMRQGSDDCCEAEAYHSSLPPTTPPVSRVRLPPSFPSVHHRIPSPPAYRTQPTSGSQTCTSSGQWREPSRPSSPRIPTWPRDDNREKNRSMSTTATLSFSDARSVFCKNPTPPCTSTLPRPWGEPSRGRLPTREPQTSVRRSQSDRRPSLTHGTCPSAINNTDTFNNATMTEGDSQSD